MDEAEYQRTLAKIREMKPEQRARDVTYRAFLTFTQEWHIPEDRAKDMVMALYHLGWQDALVYWGTVDAKWPDGTRFMEFQTSKLWDSHGFMAGNQN